MMCHKFFSPVLMLSGEEDHRLTFDFYGGGAVIDFEPDYLQKIVERSLTLGQINGDIPLRFLA